MYQKATLLVGALAGVLVIGGAACKGSLEPPGPGTGGQGMVSRGTGGSGPWGSSTGGSGAGGSGPLGLPPGSIRLAASSTGYVDDPVSGVIGPWYSYGDGVGPNANPTTTDSADSDCIKAGFTPSECSQITIPTPGQPFPPSDAATSKMCTSGIAAEVMAMNGTPDYADLWGAGIGLNFNEPIVDGSASALGTFDMSPYKGIAFDFSADVLPLQAMRVNFLFQGMHGGDAPYWMGATMLASPLTGTTAAPQHVEIDWGSVGGPFYLQQTTPPVMAPPLDTTKVEAIQFQVFTNTATTTPYSFCVANLALVP